MWKLIQLIFLGHSHQWKTIRSVPYTINGDFGSSRTGTRYYQQCETCGKVVKRDLV